MARGRLISKSLGSSRKFHALLQAGGKLGEFCQVLFPLIIANTDDFGRMPGDAFTVKNVVLPSSPRPERDFETALSVIADVALIQRYSDESGIYIQVNQFDSHQPNLHKRRNSRFPEPPGDAGTSGRKPGRTQNLEPRTQNPEPGTENLEPRTQNREPRTVPSGTAARATPRRTLTPVARASSADAALFERFWAAYPKKKAKDAAQRAWEKRRPNDELLSVMLRAIERQKSSPDWQKDSGRYIPFPATWLNQARWTDEVEVDIGDVGLSDTARYNLQASEEAERLILDAEARRTRDGRG